MNETIWRVSSSGIGIEIKEHFVTETKLAYRVQNNSGMWFTVKKSGIGNVQYTTIPSVWEIWCLKETDLAIAI